MMYTPTPRCRGPARVRFGPARPAAPRQIHEESLGQQRVPSDPPRGSFRQRPGRVGGGARASGTRNCGMRHSPGLGSAGGGGAAGVHEHHAGGLPFSLLAQLAAIALGFSYTGAAAPYALTRRAACLRSARGCSGRSCGRATSTLGYGSASPKRPVHRRQSAATPVPLATSGAGNHHHRSHLVDRLLASRDRAPQAFLEHGEVTMVVFTVSRPVGGCDGEGHTLSGDRPWQRAVCPSPPRLPPRARAPCVAWQAKDGFIKKRARQNTSLQSVRERLVSKASSDPRASRNADSNVAAVTYRVRHANQRLAHAPLACALARLHTRPARHVDVRGSSRAAAACAAHAAALRIPGRRKPSPQSCWASRMCVTSRIRSASTAKLATVCPAAATAARAPLSLHVPRFRCARRRPPRQHPWPRMRSATPGHGVPGRRQATTFRCPRYSKRSCARCTTSGTVLSTIGRRRAPRPPSASRAGATSGGARAPRAPSPAPAR